MSVAAMRQPAWLDHAWAELGQREIDGPQSNPRIADYIRRVGHPEAADDATAWCAAFVGACLERAGIKGTGSLLARSYLAWGLPAEVPEAGAVAVLSRGRNAAHGHVGFLLGMTETSVILLGGNQSNAVTVQAFARSRLLAIRSPATSAASAEMADRASDRFAWSLERVLDLEGGYSDDRFDPGGPTNKGITLATYARFKGEPLGEANYDRLKAELRAIPDEAVTRIYRSQYWLPARCPDLSAPLAHFHFDAAVNQGVAGATRMLQEALGVDVDGEIGPITLGTAARRPVHETLEHYADIRQRRYRALRHFWRFGRGWLARVDTVLSQARSLAADANEPVETHAPSTESKETSAMPDSTQPVFPPASTDGKWWGSSLTIWGALVTAASTVAPAILAAFGLDVPASIIERLGNDILTVAQAVGGLLGTLMTIAGRSRASAPLARRPLNIRL